MATKREAKSAVKAAMKAVDERIAHIEAELKAEREYLAKLKQMNSRLIVGGRIPQEDLEEMISEAADAEEGPIERTY